MTSQNASKKRTATSSQQQTNSLPGVEVLLRNKKSGLTEDNTAVEFVTAVDVGSTPGIIIIIPWPRAYLHIQWEYLLSVSDGAPHIVLDNSQIKIFGRFCSLSGTLRSLSSFVSNI